MKIARKENKSYDPVQQRENFFDAIGRSKVTCTQIDLIDPDNFQPREDGDIALSVECMFTMTVDVNLSFDDQLALLENRKADIVQTILQLAVEGMEYGIGEFAITTAPISQLVTKISLSGENNE